MRVAFHTLGCKVNSYETEQIRQALLAAGYVEHDFSPGADVYIINTCTVTNIADRKSRQMLHRAKEMNPDALVVAVGCYVDDAAALLEKDEAVDLLIGNAEKGNVARILENYFDEQRQTKEQHRMDRSVPAVERMSQAPGERSANARCRAFVKVEDGCNQFCTYCMIPYVRGRVKSRAADEVLSELAQLSKSAVKEVVLTGIHISSYGMDFDHPGENHQTPRAEEANTNTHLLSLLTKADEIEGIERIRLGSLEVGIITDAFLSGLAAMKHFCPSFHLSLQSGCDRILDAMGRKYTTAVYAEKVAAVRKVFPDASVTTDVIAGFPGEREEDFLETLAFVEEMQFAKIHVFPYSRRKGTKADAMPMQLSSAIKKERAKTLAEIDAKMQSAFASRFIGQRVAILTEEAVAVGGRRYMRGYTKSYVPAYLPDPGGDLAANCVYIAEGESEKDGALYLTCL